MSSDKILWCVLLGIYVAIEIEFLRQRQFVAAAVWLILVAYPLWLVLSVKKESNDGD